MGDGLVTVSINLRHYCEHEASLCLSLPRVFMYPHVLLLLLVNVTETSVLINYDFFFYISYGSHLYRKVAWSIGCVVQHASQIVLTAFLIYFSFIT